MFEKENWLWHWEQTVREWGQKQNDQLGGDFSNIYERCGGSDHSGGSELVSSDQSLEIIEGEANGISFQIMRYERKNGFEDGTKNLGLCNWTDEQLTWQRWP